LSEEGNARRLLIEQGDELEAAGNWRAAVDIWSNLRRGGELDFWAYYRRGLAHYALADLDSALDDLGRAVALNPLHPACQRMYVLCLTRKGRIDRSLYDGSVAFDAVHPIVGEYLGHIRQLMTYEGGAQLLPDTAQAQRISAEAAIYDVGEHDGLVSAVLNASLTNVVAGGDWDTPGRRVEEFHVYEAIKAVLFNRSARWEETEFYRENVDRIRAGDHVWNCTSVEQFAHRLNFELLDLRDKLRANGIRRQVEIGGWDPIDDIRLGVARDGRLIFLNGQHRLAMAKLMHVEAIPVQIVLRHRDWQQLKTDIEAYAAAHGGAVYQQIPHPDLIHLPAFHKLDRLRAITEKLHEKLPPGARVLDIGSHWGAAATMAAEAGFAVTAVEMNPEFLPFLRGLTAGDDRIEVWEGSIFDFDRLGEFDAFIAQNIFHHFLRTEATFASLCELLARMPKGLLLLQTHNPGTVDHGQAFHADMSVQEFLQFIIDHSAYEHSELIFVEEDGRPIYALT
jgi:2-polyprenyl-3-methyl-5-hydroxy-6-metoxy-1,4-benzoquinol methylase